MSSGQKKLSIKFKPIKMSLLHIGKRIKSTKLRYNWEFELEGKCYIIDLFISRLSGKRKILVNGDLHANEKRSNAYLCSYVFKIGTHKVELKEIDDNVFDFRVDSLSFQNELDRQNDAHSDPNETIKEPPKFVESLEEKLNKVSEPKKAEESKTQIPQAKQASDIDLLDFSEPIKPVSNAKNPFDDDSALHPVESQIGYTHQSNFSGMNNPQAFMNPFMTNMPQMNPNGMNFAAMNPAFMSQYPQQMFFYNPYFATGMQNPWMGQNPK